MITFSLNEKIFMGAKHMYGKVHRKENNLLLYTMDALRHQGLIVSQKLCEKGWGTQLDL